MHPLLPVLLVASLAGLLVRRREAGLAWTVVGLAGIALLAPALALPDGIPSPSAMLADLAPWQGQALGTSHNRELVDVSFLIEPWMLHLKRELGAGRLPFWNPYQLAGAPFWANGMSGPLSPFHWLFAALPVAVGFVLLPWVKTMIAGLGAYRLARELDIGRDGALLAAVSFALCGRVVSFLLFPMGFCFAPCVFLATERIARGRPGFRMLAVAGACQLLTGHPETPFFTGLAAGFYFVLRGAERPWRGLGRVAAGWATALAVAGAAIVPLAFAILGSAKWHHWAPGEPMTLDLVARLWLRFLLPDAFGHPATGGYWGPFSFVPTAVYLGAVALPLAAVGLASARQDRRLRALAWTALIALACAYHLPGIRQLLQALPLLQKSLHHYLLLAVELALALLAGKGLEGWKEGKARPLLVGLAGVAAVLFLAWFVLDDEWSAHGALSTQAAWTFWVLGLGLGLALALWLTPARRAALATLVIALAAADLAVAHGRTLPALPASRHFPSTPALDFLARQPGRVVAPGQALRPNTAMVFGLSDLRGDDPLKLLAYEEVYGARLASSDPVYFRPITRWQSPWLDRLGVRWVLDEPFAPPIDPSWRLAYQGHDASVYERRSALDLARLEPAGAGRVEVVEQRPGRWKIAWKTKSPARLVVAETHAPGWRARVDGHLVPIETVDGLLMGIPLAAGRGEVELTYRPPGLLAGTILSLLGLLALTWGRRWVEPESTEPYPATDCRSRARRRAPAADPCPPCGSSAGRRPPPAPAPSAAGAGNSRGSCSAPRSSAASAQSSPAPSRRAAASGARAAPRPSAA